MERATRTTSPRVALRRDVVGYLTQLRALGLTPNRGVAFCPDPACDVAPACRGWLLVDPRTHGERWLLLDDGDVWHEREGVGDDRLGQREPTYEWLARPTEALERLLTHSLFNARLGGSGFLTDEERFARRPYVVGDRRTAAASPPGEERRRVL